MAIRTDLALEMLEAAGELLPQGVRQEKFQENGIEVTRVQVETEEAARILRKPVGSYYTMETADFKSVPPDFAAEVEAAARVLSRLLPPKDQPVLVIGLGNQEITPDALGPKAVRLLLATRHIRAELAEEIGLGKLRPVSLLAPGVLGQTGIETAEIAAALAGTLRPSAVVVIDALAAKSVDRLARTLQISTAGISPGSGVQNTRRELSERTLGVPVISMGVPMVVDMTTVACDLLQDEAAEEKVSEAGQGMMVTPREIDLAVEHAAKLTAFGLNRALQPDLSLTDLQALVGG